MAQRTPRPRSSHGLLASRTVSSHAASDCSTRYAASITPMMSGFRATMGAPVDFELSGMRPRRHEPDLRALAREVHHRLEDLLVDLQHQSREEILGIRHLDGAFA